MTIMLRRAASYRRTACYLGAILGLEIVLRTMGIS